MAQAFLPTPGGNIYPDPDTSYDQSEAFRQVALNRDARDTATLNAAKTYADGKAYLRGVLPDGTDLNTYNRAQYAGVWSITSTPSSTTMTNLPFTGRSIIRIEADPNGGSLCAQTVYGLDEKKTAERTGVGTTFTAWDTGESSGGGSSDAGAAHLMRVNDARWRKGYTIGTGSITNVAFRWDHGTVAVRDTLLALLRKYDLPSTVAHYSRQVTMDPTWHGVPFSEVQGWNLNDGLEAHCHSATHLNANTEAGMIDEIQTSRLELEAAMPQSPIDGWCPPGLGDAGYNNEAPWNDPQLLASTVSGRLILSNYGFIAGYYGGRFRKPGGVPTPDLTHYTWDSATGANQVVGLIQTAQRTGSSIAFMAHPHFIERNVDDATWAQVEAVFAWVAGERDAGRLNVLTLGGLAVADTTHTTRPSVLANGDFVSLDGWTITGHSQVVEGDDTVMQGTASSGDITQFVSVLNQAWARGGIFEALIEVRAPDGANVRVCVDDADNTANLYANKQFTIPASTDWVPIRKFCQFPLTGNANLRVRFGRVSGGAVAFRRAEVRTA